MFDKNRLLELERDLANLRRGCNECILDLNEKLRLLALTFDLEYHPATTKAAGYVKRVRASK